LKVNNLVIFAYVAVAGISYWSGHDTAAIIWVLLALHHEQRERLIRIENNQEQFERTLRSPTNRG
jgi:hypothetical protein